MGFFGIRDQYFGLPKSLQIEALCDMGSLLTGWQGRKEMQATEVRISIPNALLPSAAARLAGDLGGNILHHRN